MKKLIALMLALMMSAFVLVSCGPDEAPDDGVPPVGDDGGLPLLPSGSDNAMPDNDWDLLG